MKQEFDINLKKVAYLLDKSELLYLKIDKKIQCAGKLKMIVSPDKIDPSAHFEESTCEYLEKMLLKGTAPEQ